MTPNDTPLGERIARDIRDYLQRIARSTAREGKPPERAARTSDQIAAALGLGRTHTAARCAVMAHDGALVEHRNRSQLRYTAPERST